MAGDLIRIRPEGFAILAAIKLLKISPALEPRIVEVQAALIPLFEKAMASSLT